MARLPTLLKHLLALLFGNHWTCRTPPMAIIFVLILTLTPASSVRVVRRCPNPRVSHLGGSLVNYGEFVNNNPVDLVGQLLDNDIWPFEHFADTFILLVLISDTLVGHITESVGDVFAVTAVTACVAHAENPFCTPGRCVIPVSDTVWSA